MAYTSVKIYLPRGNIRCFFDKKLVVGQKLMNEKVDVFIGNHVWNNDTEGKIEKLGKSEKNPFVDPEEWQRFLKEKLDEADELFKTDPLD